MSGEVGIPPPHAITKARGSTTIKRMAVLRAGAVPTDQPTTHHFRTVAIAGIAAVGIRTAPGSKLTAPVSHSKNVP